MFNTCLKCGKAVKGFGKVGLCLSCIMQSEEYKSNMSKALKGKKKPPRSKEWKLKQSLCRKGKPLSSLTRKRISLALKGRIVSNETRKKIREALQYKPLPKETRAKISNTHKARWQDIELRKEASNITQQLWKNREYQQKVYKSQVLKPTTPEFKLGICLDSLNIDCKYVGDFSLFIGGKNPDFIINNSNKLIELFGDYWHEGEDGSERVKHFKKYGFDTLVIWEHELKDIGTLKQKLYEFQGGDAQ